jgi:predicted anti-sigma-YlaC factor YlaD
VECREAAAYFPGYVEHPGGPHAGVASQAVEAHLRSCARCRAELDEYRQLEGVLASLATHTVEPPAWLTAALMETVRTHAARRLRLPAVAIHAPALNDPRVAAAGGAILVAGLAAGALLLRGRRRRRRGMRRLRTGLMPA